MQLVKDWWNGARLCDDVYDINAHYLSVVVFKSQCTNKETNI